MLIKGLELRDGGDPSDIASAMRLLVQGNPELFVWMRDTLDAALTTLKAEKI